MTEPHWQTCLRAMHGLEKNRDKLFTFLEYDGVSWNNNNAEHAIKAFARLREFIVIHRVRSNRKRDSRIFDPSEHLPNLQIHGPRFFGFPSFWRKGHLRLRQKEGKTKTDNTSNDAPKGRPPYIRARCLLKKQAFPLDLRMKCQMLKA
jgi:hypothetical protein